MFRKINHKVSSFSLIETLVVLLLSSMVVTIVYFSYYTVTTYQYNMVRRYTKFADQSHIYFLLKKDFERSYSIRTKDNQAIHCSMSDSILNVHYYFSPFFVARKQHGQIDTFFCKTSQPEMSWKGNPLEPESYKIDEIRFSMEGLSDSLQLVFHKEYDRASLIETVNDSIP